ncbi:MAG: outer membrane beta-barrel protein [Holosporaceae bacterium]|nr:outer membrane beta-barrel protein [Holosporaceae bacterium]
MKKIVFTATVAIATVLTGLVSAYEEGGDAAYDDESLSGIFFGVGGGYSFASKDSAKSLSSSHEASKNVDRLMGTIIFGSGKTMLAHRIYLGGEILVDFAKTKRSDQKLDSVDVKLRNNGVTSSFGFRIGYPGTASCTLFFIKAGATYAKSVLEYNNWRLTNAKLTPFFGFGMEKAFNKRVSLRGDLEYRLKNDKKNSEYKLERGHAVNIRVLGVYHVKY